MIASSHDATPEQPGSVTSFAAISLGFELSAAVAGVSLFLDGVTMLICSLADSKLSSASFDGRLVRASGDLVLSLRLIVEATASPLLRQIRNYGVGMGMAISSGSLHVCLHIFGRSNVFFFWHLTKKESVLNVNWLPTYTIISFTL